MRQTALIAASLVTEVAAVTTAGLLLGNWLDERWGTSPWLVFLLTAMGFTGGMYRLLLGLQRLQDDDDRRPPTDDA